ncbi:MAG: carbon-nitrogen hydrolase family protein [Candidatus Lokiarchaeota archaeon]|nr:carbon-nitrogen hydrolase family protein [Candidatus Lokiarchaeota archaeon]
MKIACIQPEVAATRNECYTNVESIIRDLTDQYENCDIVCLPERWTPYSIDVFKNFQQERGDDYLFVKKLARTYRINLLSGGIWEKREYSKKPFVTCYFFNDKGEEVTRQDKIHLYAYERGIFQGGKELKIVRFKEVNFAILICFDVAFYETPRLAAENGADLVFSPTQIREEGLYNWNIYLQARSLENRMPIAACNTLGKINNRNFPGKSKIISFLEGDSTPSKLRVLEAPENQSGFIYDDIDLDFPKKIRSIRISEKIEKTKIIISKIS